MKFVDLSTVLAGDLKSDIPHQAPKIQYRTHEDNKNIMASRFQIDPAEFPLDAGWATEVVTFTSHSGCHMDAPYHG